MNDQPIEDIKLKQSMSDDEFYQQLEENYQLAIAEYEEKYKAALKSKDEEIAIYKNQVEELKKIILSLSKAPIVIQQEPLNN